VPEDALVIPSLPSVGVMTNPEALSTDEAHRLEEFLRRRRRSRKERAELGKAMRASVPRDSHGQLPPGRPDVVGMLTGQDANREAALVPLRYERMSVDPFAFLRGSAAVMAADLAGLPRTSAHVQLCGDAHLSNFGMFASPDRRLVFDLNDFDETLSGPFEWDVKRLAASVAVAGQHNGMKVSVARRAAVVTVRSYRETIRRLAGLPTLDVWYTRLDVDPLLDQLKRSALNAQARRARDKAWRNTGDVAVAKLTETTGGRRSFRSDPPLLVRVSEAEHEGVAEWLYSLFVGYLETLSEDRVALLLRFSLADLAHKVVGVGSVGTRALVLLLEGGGGAEPLLLQVKQANASVLEPYLHDSRLGHHGRRVVVGQHLMQTTSDPFLGWSRAGDPSCDYYVRQLRDMKGSIEPALLGAEALSVYGQLCGAVLARAHARAGDPSVIAGYLGRSAAFEEAVGDFARGYADITEKDHWALVRARASGAVPTIAAALVGR